MSKFKNRFFFKATLAILSVSSLLIVLNFHNAIGDSATMSSREILDRPINTLRDLNQAFVDISAKVKPAVVTVSTERIFKQRFYNPFSSNPFLQQFFGQRGRRQQPQEREYRREGLGSGVIISADGLIITNNHVIDDADSIVVQTHDGNHYTAEVVGVDKQTDIAVLRIDGDDLPYLEFGDSDELQVGEIVLAIGSPMSQNLAYSVTQGIVSAKGRSNVGLAEYEDFVQTDAAINPGNSGGPLVNLDGELVGINTAIVSRSGGNQGIGFAVPSRMAESVMRSLVDQGKVVRGWLGVYIQDVSEDIADAFNLKDNRGALVSEVMEDSPAGKAGLQAGDVILEVDGRSIESSTELRSTIASNGPNTEVRLKILRDGDVITKDLTLGELPGEVAATGVNGGLEELLGFSFSDLNRQLAEQFQLEQWTNGVVVTDIDPNSNAARAGLRAGDIITGVNRVSLKDEDDFKSLLAKIGSGDNLLLRIYRGGRNLFIAFRV